MSRITLALILVLLALPVAGHAQSAGGLATRDETSRLAVAVLGRICVLNIGDYNATITSAAPTGEFGFADVTPDVAETFLKGRSGLVRVLRRPGLGAITLVMGQDGICTVWSEYGDATSLQRHLLSMVERGGLKGGAQLLALDARDESGQTISDYYLMPADWFARDLGRRTGEDGSQPLALVTSVSAPGRRPMEAMLSVSRILKK
ncbi:hypothetical protein CCC_00572 [Paramagnetospirillum magnetotacticum MS-1]|uniref:Uncharacterized protein n=1 Tax=Paramagnetospirillum magnetotacticum MS-1 TaxID=272627 RepID=A0A0C2UXG5_PARME|nr:hypothetical protein [Paramagnetospirillum magnetotacticum]KIL97511.1 hypothetical protein CCC_00572 [Paramagnetospirillum magnetotacticum MS-1]